MRDDVSRLVGLDGVGVTGVVEVGRQLEIEVELLVEVACCRWCGRASLVVKDRPVVRIRDLSIAGRVTFLRWRKRRYWCEGCERTFTETHPALPSRQRVSARFRVHLFERCQGGGAHAEVARDERTSRYQVYRAFASPAMSWWRGGRTGRRGGFHWMRRITAVAANWRRSSLTWTAGG